jgi:galactoside O-acetyltransferase
VLLCPLLIGEGSTIGVNSVVTKDTEPWGIYVGTPAVFVKYREKENIIKYGNIIKPE